MQKYHHNTLVAGKQPSASITQQQEFLNAVESYIEAGFCIVPIPFGKKAPALKGWNKRSNTIASHDHIERLTGLNIGLAHAYSGTCAIDVDDYIKANEYFDDNGIDLPSLLAAPDAVQIKSGRENRAKLLYRTPEVLTTFKHSDGSNTVVEFRCAASNGLTVQDVLPPSIHPDTGKPYSWQGDFTNLPILPAEIHSFWLQKNLSNLPSTVSKDEKTHRRNMYSVGDAMYSMGVPAVTPLLDHVTSTAQVRKLFCTESKQRQLLDYLGFKSYGLLFKNGRASVRSVIPPDDHNSGGLILSDQGEVLFYDFSGALGHQHVTLPVLYARLVAGRYVHLIPTEKDGNAYGKVTLAVWAVRLLVDAGIVKPAKVLLSPCPELRKSVKEYYAGVKLLFQVRWAFKEHYASDVTMGRTFMSPWTGLSEDQCRTAIKDLLKAGVIHTAGQHGRSRLYAPGYKPPQKPKGRTDK